MLLKILQKYLYISLSFCLLFSACDRAGPAKGSEGHEVESTKQLAVAAKLDKSDYQQVAWVDLMPEDDLEALLNPPDYINYIEEGSGDDQLIDEPQGSLIDTAEDRYQQALASTRVIAEMDGRAIRIPGYIVPLEFNDEQAITQFFLVPYFGACIHSPPPPPNQMLYVEHSEGLALDELYDPFWISGVVKTSLKESDLGAAAYSMRLDYIDSYRD
ncbi:DUF3299 domain-containing protein [Agaribacterium sp. ZY112]|uniref:DUF3299 domain-containing protein n=1 Tax=Agaribacterium sp. ZY112 TaxID=3233574 RepID=UPI003524E61C